MPRRSFVKTWRDLLRGYRDADLVSCKMKIEAASKTEPGEIMYLSPREMNAMRNISLLTLAHGIGAVILPEKK